MNRLSPFAATLGIREDVDATGKAICVMEPDDAAFARDGVMHGGAVAAFLQHAGRLATLDALAARGTEASIGVVSITVDYLRPAKLAPSRSAATIIKLGARVANVTVAAWNEGEDGKPYAMAKLTIGIAG